MAKIESHKPRNFCWVELGTTDQDAAKEFYGGLFGWKWDDNPMGPGETYTMFNLEGEKTGGAYRINPTTMPGVPPHWMVYIAVADAGSVAAKVEALGGKLLNGPFDVMSHGRMAVIRDPGGATFCIWEPKSHIGVTLVGEEGTYCWADLSTPDVDGSKAFYEGLFGWIIEAAPNDPSGYLHIQNGPDFIGGVPPAQHRNPNTPAHWLAYFQTGDCDGLVAEAQGRGAKVLAPPMSLPGVGRFSVISDPQGAVFALFEPQHAA